MQFRSAAWHNVVAVRVPRVSSNRVENLMGMIPSWAFRYYGNGCYCYIE